MKLSKFCGEELIHLDLKAKSKEEAIRELVALAARSKLVKDEKELLAAVLEREKLVTTGVGYGVAFPHAKTKATRGVVIAFGRSKGGLDFEAMDKKPVSLFFLIAAPEDAIGAHLNVMAQLSFIMKEEKNRKRFMEVKSPGEVLEALDKAAEGG
ncbi:MAG: PTS sugar transporter subunit IIA [Limisphaerales bacterium]